MQNIWFRLSLTLPVLNMALFDTSGRQFLSEFSSFFSLASVLPFCPKSSAVSTQPPGISRLPLLSNDTQSFLCVQPPVVGNSSQQINTLHCRQGRWSWRDTFHLQVYTRTHTHIDIQRWFSLTCVSNIKTLSWPFFVVVFEQFRTKDNKNRGWFIHIHSI